MAEVSIEKLVKRFGAAEIIHGIDLTIPESRLTVLLGPSGCGKSTLLRMIAGLEDISAGAVRIGGRLVNEVDPAERGCAMVFQNYALYPHQTVYKNLAFPLKMAGWAKPRIAARVQETAELLQIDPLMDRLPRDLSGGQRQRVAMGRALIRNPKVFLFDEPLSNLDAELRVRMRLEISRMQGELDATMVFVTHDQVEAMTLAHKIVVMREGRIEQTGTPLEIYNHPRTRFVAGFIGSPAMNFFEVGEVAATGPATRITLSDGTAFTTPGRVPAETRMIGLRPQEISASSRAEDAIFSVAEGAYRTLGVEHLGDRAFRYLSTSFGDVAVQHQSAETPSGAGPLHLTFDPAVLQAFDGDGMALRIREA